MTTSRSDDYIQEVVSEDEQARDLLLQIIRIVRNKNVDSRKFESLKVLLQPAKEISFPKYMNKKHIRKPSALHFRFVVNQLFQDEFELIALISKLCIVQNQTDTEMVRILNDVVTYVPQIIQKSSNASIGMQAVMNTDIQRMVLRPTEISPAEKKVIDQIYIALRTKTDHSLEAFRVFDTQHTMKLMFRDFISGLEYLRIQIPTIDAINLYSKFDTSCNGYISFEDFQAWFSHPYHDHTIHKFQPMERRRIQTSAKLSRKSAFGMRVKSLDKVSALSRPVLGNKTRNSAMDKNAKFMTQ